MCYVGGCYGMGVELPPDVGVEAEVSVAVTIFKEPGSIPGSCSYVDMAFGLDVGFMSAGIEVTYFHGTGDFTDFAGIGGSGKFAIGASIPTVVEFGGSVGECLAYCVTTDGLECGEVAEIVTASGVVEVEPGTDQLLEYKGGITPTNRGYLKSFAALPCKHPGGEEYECDYTALLQEHAPSTGSTYNRGTYWQYRYCMDLDTRSTTWGNAYMYSCHGHSDQLFWLGAAGFSYTGGNTPETATRFYVEYSSSLCLQAPDQTYDATWPAIGNAQFQQCSSDPDDESQLFWRGGLHWDSDHNKVVFAIVSRKRGKPNSGSYYDYTQYPDHSYAAIVDGSTLGPVRCLTYISDESHDRDGKDHGGASTRFNARFETCETPHSKTVETTTGSGEYRFRGQQMWFFQTVMSAWDERVYEAMAGRRDQTWETVDWERAAAGGDLRLDKLQPVHHAHKRDARERKRHAHERGAKQQVELIEQLEKASTSSSSSSRAPKKFTKAEKLEMQSKLQAAFSKDEMTKKAEEVMGRTKDIESFMATCTVTYEDGESENKVTPNRIKGLLRNDDEVMVKQEGGEFMKGTLSGCSGGKGAGATSLPLGSPLTSAEEALLVRKMDAVKARAAALPNQDPEGTGP